jgi:hypothetical protein
MLLVRVALFLAAVAAGAATLLADTAEKLPETAPVPAVCVTVPVLNQGGLQAGYCPE